MIHNLAFLEIARGRKLKKNLGKNQNSLTMPKDKEFPKRPPGPYILFMQNQQKEREGRPFGEWSRQVSEKWRNMAENQKQIWVETAAQAKARYEKEKAKRNPMTTRLRRKSVRPRNAYIFFSMEKRPQVVREHPDVGPHQIMRILARMWVELSSLDKEKYNKMALIDKKRYLSVRPKIPNTRKAQTQAAQASNPGPSKPARPTPN